MKIRLNKISLLFPILSILYLLNMKGIISNVMIIFLINLLFFLLYFINSFIKKRGLYDILFESMIISMPISFLSLIGGDYGDFPLSWFNLFYIIIILYSIIEKKLSYIPWLSLIVILGIIENLIGSDLRNAMNQFINVMLFSFSFVIGKGVYYKKSHCLNSYIKLMKVIVLSYAITLIVQSFFIEKGINVGVFDFMGGNRLSLGATFTDYSFASLFLFVGISIYLTNLGKSVLIKILNISCILIIFSANFIVDARTGIVGFFIALLIYLMTMILRKKRKMFFVISACCLLPVVLFSAIYISNSRNQSLLNGSGRIDTYRVGLEVFFQHPLTGIGFGVQNYSRTVNEAIPHNLIFQYLAQTGIVYTCIILAPLFFCVFYSYKKNMTIFLTMLTMIAGGMFIPDILNSRFIILLIIIFYSEKGVCERRVLYEGKNCNILHVE